MAKEKKEETKPESQPESAVASKGKKSIATIGVFAGIMIAEGVGIFLCMKFLGSDPDPTLGVEGIVTPTTQPWKDAADALGGPERAAGEQANGAPARAAPASSTDETT